MASSKPSPKEPTPSTKKSQKSTSSSKSSKCASKEKSVREKGKEKKTPDPKATRKEEKEEKEENSEKQPASLSLSESTPGKSESTSKKKGAATKKKQSPLVSPSEGESESKISKKGEAAEKGRKGSEVEIPSPKGAEAGEKKPKATVQFGKKPSLAIAPGAYSSGLEPKASETQKKKEEPRSLTPQELAEIKATLLARREVLLQELRKELADSKGRTFAVAADPIDQASDSYDEDVAREIVVNNDKELDEIEEALDKMENGTYGFCEFCDAPIPPSRLKVLPYATACVKCTGQKELVLQSEETTPWALLSDEDEEEEE